MGCAPAESGEYRMLSARIAGELLAFVIFFMQSDGIASIVDLFGDCMADVGTALLDAVIEMSRGQNLQAVHGFCSEGSELDHLFQSAGFRP